MIVDECIVYNAARQEANMQDMVDAEEHDIERNE